VHVPKPAGEQAEVVALRKKIRGEPLTETEQSLLASLSRKPRDGGVPITREQMSALLEERKRRGE
jgi:hypothetical protein